MRLLLCVSCCVSPECAPRYRAAPLQRFPQSLDAFDSLMLGAADGLTHAVRSLRTTLCVRFKSETVACGIIFMAARRCKVCIHSLLL